MLSGWLVACLCVSPFVIGCGAYYKVRDPASGKVYFTEEIDGAKGGSAKVKDCRTGDPVTILNSEVKEISKEEYRAGVLAMAAPTGKQAPEEAKGAPDGPAIFASQCAGCHGDDAKGGSARGIAGKPAFAVSIVVKAQVGPMSDVKLSPEEVKAVSAYVGCLE
jgi:mono/diheme cytochrome c family protein